MFFEEFHCAACLHSLSSNQSASNFTVVCGAMEPPEIRLGVSYLVSSECILTHRVYEKLCYYWVKKYHGLFNNELEPHKYTKIYIG